MIGRAALTVALVIAPACLAAAQSGFGDTSLTYSGGVVWDDDVVPGRPPNQPFLPQARPSVPLSGLGLDDRAPAIPPRPRQPLRDVIEGFDQETERVRP